MIAMVEPCMTEEEIQRAIVTADVDGDGTIDYKDLDIFANTSSTHNHLLVVALISDAPYCAWAVVNTK